MADLDLDDLAARRVVQISPAERDALVAAVRWAQDAPHHDGCHATGCAPHLSCYRCTCGRDEALAPFGGDRG